MEYNELEPVTSVSGSFGWIGWPEETRKKMAAPTYKVVVKNGDSTYNYDEKTGTYKYKTVDYVVESGNLADALLAFLEYATDDYNEDKVTLTLVPSKKKGKK